MDRVTALKSYQETVSIRIPEFRSGMEEYLLQHSQELEDLVKNAVDLLGKEMERKGKEYVSFLYFSLLKTDLIQGKNRFLFHGLDMRWYLDEEPVEVYVDAGTLLEPLRQVWGFMDENNGGYGGAVNRYDIQNIFFDEIGIYNNILCQILRYRLRDWEQKGIFSSIALAPYWVLKWGEYRDSSEILVRVDRTEKQADMWKKEIGKAAREPETLVFGYWYKGEFEGNTLEGLDMRFTVFEECRLKKITFKNCNMEGSRFSKSMLMECRFENCSLWGADFRSSGFEKGSFEGSELTAAVFPAESIPYLDISAEQLQALYIDREESK